MDKYQEEVLVVTRDLFVKLGEFQGFQAEAPRYLHSFFQAGNFRFLTRAAVEEDAGFKQIIPYVLFRHRGRWLRYLRGSAIAEQRLAGRASMGIGGHVNKNDYAASEGEFGESAYFAGLAREVAEELRTSGATRQRLVGLVNNDSTPVGSVHLGVVHVFELEDGAVEPAEADLTQLQWLTPKELEAEEELLEGWSRICLAEILEGRLD